MRPIFCPETSARNYHYTLRNKPVEHIPYLLLCYTPDLFWRSPIRIFANNVQAYALIFTHIFFSCVVSNVIFHCDCFIAVQCQTIQYIIVILHIMNKLYSEYLWRNRIINLKVRFYRKKSV